MIVSLLCAFYCGVALGASCSILTDSDEIASAIAAGVSCGTQVVCQTFGSSCSITSVNPIYKILIVDKTVKRIYFPQLTSATSIEIYNSMFPVFTADSIEFPSLSTMSSSLRITEDCKVFDFSVLSSVGGTLNIGFQVSPLTITFPSLISIGGDATGGLSIVGRSSGALTTSIRFPLLQTISSGGLLTGQFLPLLSQLDLGSLVSITGPVQLGTSSSNDPLTSLFLPVNSVSGQSFLNIYYPNANISLPYLRSVGYYSASFRSIQISAKSLELCVSSILVDSNGPVPHFCAFPNDGECLLCQTSAGASQTCNITTKCLTTTTAPATTTTTSSATTTTSNATTRPACAQQLLYGAFMLLILTISTSMMLE